jgi:hypothetical protein
MKYASTVIVSTLILVLGAPVVAAEDPANTIASSTMVFQGTLTNQGGGVYTGILPMINESGTSYGDGITGFDVYAKNGAWATYDLTGSGGENYTSGQVADHDAYKQGGGWGATYDPDCADWYNYQLRLTSDGWYVEYNGNVGNDGDTTGASAPPMSGSMDWGNLVATETDTGAYYSGMGTAENAGYAATFAADKSQSTAGAWDMDWSWGSDYVPLQDADFDVTVDFVDGGTSTVTLTPTPEPATMALLGLGAVALIRRRRK